jgi:flagellar biosynthetic protein FliR
MEQIINEISLNIDYFLLMFIRTGALIISSPIFGRRNIPNTAKICFCILLTYVLFAALPAHEAIVYTNVLEYALMVLKEFLFGLVMGFVTTMFFALTQTAGHVIDMMMGFGMVNVFDVQGNVKVPVTGNFFYIILIITFFTVNAHHQLIHILNVTFQSIPVGRVVLSPKIAYTALEVFILAFVLAVNVAMPIIASGLLGEIVMGFIVRLVPQMNIFVVGIPLKVGLGLIMLFFVLPIYVSFTDVIFSDMFNSLDKMFRALGAV